MWWVVGPAIVCEGLGPIDGLARSAYLTKGRRWPIFGLILLDLVVIGIIFYTLSKATGIPIEELMAPSAVSISSAICFVAATLAATFSSLLAVTTYDRLRHEKDEVPAHEVARIFD